MGGSLRYDQCHAGWILSGDVGNVSSDLLSYSFKNVKYSFGGGLRYQFNKKEKVNLRVDIGIEEAF